MDPLIKAIDTAGGLTALGRKIGVTPQRIYNWRRSGKIPANQVLAIERATGVSRHSMRPDIYPLGV
jgi:DNA-binding transcriptional regulator YdaS (Cro superfamily)